MRDLRVISGPSGIGSWRVILGHILDPFWTHSRPYLRNLIRNLKNCLQTAVGRALRLNMSKIWVLGWLWVVPGIAPLQPTPVSHTPGTPSPPGTHGYTGARVMHG